MSAGRLRRASLRRPRVGRRSHPGLPFRTGAPPLASPVWSAWYTERMLLRIAIALYDGFDELDAIAPFEVLRTAAAFGARFDVQLLALGAPRAVTASHGLEVRVARDVVCRLIHLS
jgi:hypothetical protein